MYRNQTHSLHPSNRTTHAELEELFTYHSPTGTQADRYLRLRCTAKVLAQEILTCCPPCADTSAALRKLRECVMTANAAIALEDRETAEALEKRGQS